MSHFGMELDVGPCDNTEDLYIVLAQDSTVNLEGFENFKGLAERATQAVTEVCRTYRHSYMI